MADDEHAQIYIKTFLGVLKSGGSVTFRFWECHTIKEFINERLRRQPLYQAGIQIP
jgi:hypothetical protein